MSVTSFKEETTQSLPFPEWLDSDLNSGIWEPLKKQKSKDIIYFEDEQKVLLPPSIAPSVSHWKRPRDIFQTERLVVYEDSAEYSNLAKGSKHLLHSEFVRHFISAIGIMEYMGSNKTLVTEGVTQKFTPNTDSEYWRPWHHVYSLIKAGKGQKHKPQVNQTGKYVVRLFWMGCWRQIIVDDKIPIDSEENVLLPSFLLPVSKVNEIEVTIFESIQSQLSKGITSKESNKSSFKEEVKETVQIWPFILSKALLKIASLTWNDRREVVDFDVISCFTGWIVQKIDTRDLTAADKWEICRQFTNHYSWDDDVTKSQSDIRETKSKQSFKSKKGGSSKSGYSPQKQTTPFYLVGICKDMSSCEENEVPDMCPCCSHLFLIDQIRDIPLMRPEPKPELERWKKFRWLAWAIQKGLIEPPQNMDAIKCLKLISILRKDAKMEIPTEQAACIKMSVEAIEDANAEILRDKKKNKSSVSVKSSVSAKSKKKVIVLPALPDISIWCDFSSICQYIDCLNIYFKVSGFEYKTTITNMTELESNVDPRGKTKAPPVIVHSQALNQFKNEPLYIFVDSLDYKFVLFNLVQPGLKQRIFKRSMKKQEESFEVFNQTMRSVSNEQLQDVYVDVLEIIRSRKNITVVEETVEDDDSDSVEMPQKEETFSLGHLIVEDYNWQSEQTSNIRVFLNSLGTKSVLINLEEGRFCLRLWIETNEQYILNILTDTNLTIGGLELILDSMKAESHRLMNCCFKVSSAYGQLLQSFGTPDYTLSLKKFYNSLKPDVNYKKRDFENILDLFLENLLIFLRKSFNQSDYKSSIIALRTLFLNRNIGFSPPKNLQAEIETDFNISACEPEDVILLKEIERAAVTIQAFFKRVYVQNLKRRQISSHKDFASIFEILRKIYTSCFCVEKRLTVCLNFLRTILQKPGISEFFPWIKDLNSVIDIESFTGSSPVTFANWIPICRYLLYCQAERPLIAKICLFGETEQCLIRVFDNDSGLEIPRHTYTCIPYEYRQNEKGYTILCYGWTINPKPQVSWRLVFITLKQQSHNEFILRDGDLETKALTMPYIPNINQQIFSCNLTLQQDTLATFRLCTSYESSKLLLKCIKDNKLLSKICGTGNIILPAMFLECENIPMEEDLRKTTVVSKTKRSGSKNASTVEGKKNKDTKSERTSDSIKTSDLGRFPFKESKCAKKETTYTVEAYLLKDSWPLTTKEWEVVKTLKKKKLLEAVRTSLIKIKEKSTSRLSIDVEVEKPFWCLQTVINKGNVISIKKDSTREDEINNIKRAWYTEQPDRYARSQELREKHIKELLADMCINNEISDVSVLSSNDERTCQSPELIRNTEYTKKLLNRYSTRILSEDEELDKKLQTLEHDKKDIAYREQKIEEFNEYQKRFERDMNYYLMNQLERCTVLETFITNCRLESAAIFEEDRQKRKQYVEMICPPSPPTQKGKKKK